MKPNQIIRQRKVDSIFYCLYAFLCITTLTITRRSFHILSFFFIFEKLAPYGFMRIQNEKNTLRPFLSSIEDSIFRGVIVFVESNDGTEEILYDFVRSHPYFSIYKYPFMVKRKNLQRYEERLDFFYNFVLSKIPQNAWFIKLDADNIYSKDNLQKLMEVPKNDYDIACLPYLNLYCDTTYRVPFYIYNGNQIVKNVCDHWLLKNFGCYFELVDQDDNSSYEILKTKEERHEIFVSIQALHFPFQKTRRNNWVKGAKMSKIYIRNKNRPKIDGTKCSKSLCSYQNLYQACKEISKQSSYLYHCWWWLQDNFLSIIEEISQLIQQTQFIFTFVFLLWYLFRILYEHLHPRNCRKPSKAEKEPLLLRTNDDEFLIGN